MTSMNYRNKMSDIGSDDNMNTFIRTNADKQYE